MATQAVRSGNTCLQPIWINYVLLFAASTLADEIMSNDSPIVS